MTFSEGRGGGYVVVVVVGSEMGAAWELEGIADAGVVGPCCCCCWFGVLLAKCGDD